MPIPEFRTPDLEHFLLYLGAQREALRDPGAPWLLPTLNSVLLQ